MALKQRAGNLNTACTDPAMDQTQAASDPHPQAATKDPAIDQPQAATKDRAFDQPEAATTEYQKNKVSNQHNN